MAPLLAPSAAPSWALDWRGGSQISSQPRMRTVMRGTPSCSKTRPTSSANWRSPEITSPIAAPLDIGRERLDCTKRSCLRLAARGQHPDVVLTQETPAGRAGSLDLHRERERARTAALGSGLAHARGAVPAGRSRNCHLVLHWLVAGRVPFHQRSPSAAPGGPSGGRSDARGNCAEGSSPIAPGPGCHCSRRLTAGRATPTAGRATQRGPTGLPPRARFSAGPTCSPDTHADGDALPMSDASSGARQADLCRATGSSDGGRPATPPAPGPPGYRALLGTYLGPQWPRVLLLVLLLTATIGLQLASPQLLRRFIDDAMAGAPVSALAQLALLFLGAALALQLAQLAEVYVAETVGLTATNR